MGAKQAKPKGKYLKELHTRVPNMNVEEICQMYEEFRATTNGKTEMNKKDFVTVYTKVFNTKGVTQLAENIFASFDTDGSGTVNFEEFLIGLSITEASDPTDKANRKKKLRWAFSVYDKDKSGTIDRDEMRHIVKAVSDIIPDDQFLRGQSYQVYADDLFNSVDTNGSGDITFEEFVAAAERDETIMDLLLPSPTTD